MTKATRITDFLSSLLQLLFVIMILIAPTLARGAITSILQTLLLVSGVRYLVYYFKMARYMVNGKLILYKGGIYLDLCVVVGYINTLPTMSVMLYLAGFFALCGIYRCLKVLDTRKLSDGKWLRMAGIAAWYLTLALIGLLNLGSETVMAYLFCVEMSLSAINRMVRVFKRTAIVYIQ